ncbi:UNVERIFIED_ORG: hypothetical protein JN05_04721 [Zoogloea ramigera]|uniref:Secreted protein n=1 Tax=Duganella zoogloeoides TaxID=75659 RepID=A0ABZ0XYU3_9BURK|nr:hypothetical protein [Duganella zoogloeoides]WQH04376.1 hypothetical protein SR858_25615 [Duganella zoogloeoides]
MSRSSRSLLALLLATTWFSISAPAAADAAPPSVLIEQALRCELPTGKSVGVQKSLRRFGAKPTADGVADSFQLPKPVRPFNLDVTRVSASGAEVDTYIAVLPGARLEDVAKAANLKKGPAGYSRDTKFGTLQADVREHGDIWLMCTVLR